MGVSLGRGVQDITFRKDFTMSKTTEQQTFEEIILKAFKRYEDDSPLVYDDMECMHEDNRTVSEVLHGGFKTKTFDLNEFLSEYLCEDVDFRYKVQELFDKEF